MKLINNLLNRITMYQAMLYTLRVLIAASVVLSYFDVINYIWWHILVNMVLFLVFCWASNQLFAKIFNAKPNYESQYITAEILTLIVGPLDPTKDWWIIFLISFLAMASKYVIAYNKRHIFNPAATGVLAAALLIQQGASWWVGGRHMLPFVVLGGLFVAQKLKWFHLVVSFMVTYLAALAVSILAQGGELSTVRIALQSTVIDSATIFFATVMLVEPLTAPRTRSMRMAYGAFVAIVMVSLPLLFPTYGYSIETALLIGNLGAFLLSNKIGRQTLKLLEQTQEAKDTYSLWFEPSKKLDFIPGQFLEWTLPHSKIDSRGIRRFFSIASSPTDGHIRLVTKTNPGPSSFKKALLNMKPGDKISVSSLEGEFTMPKNNAKLAFIAGGVGITPFLSMIKYLQDKKQNKDIVLFYANKTADEIAFKNFFKESAGIGLKTVYVVTENPPSGWTGQTGFITPEMIRNQMSDWKDRIFYVSGPEPMVMAYEKMLAQMGVARRQIKRDYFPGYQA
jgi:glycine betaine catabolism B